MIDASCCCDVSGEVGFDGPNWPIFSCFSAAGYSAIDNISSTNFSRLSECRLLITGNDNVCGPAVRFSADKWAGIRSYIEGGGRVWLQSEYNGCLGDPATLADFLVALGSTMTWVAMIDPSGGSCDNTTWTCTPGAANIAQGLNIRTLYSARIDGGTSVWVTNAGNVVVAVERIGQGFLFLTADSNITAAPCPDLSSPLPPIIRPTIDAANPYNCPFLLRLMSYDDGDII